MAERPKLREGNMQPGQQELFQDIPTRDLQEQGCSKVGNDAVHSLTGHSAVPQGINRAGKNRGW